jgi:D-amino peptidase
VVVKVFMHWDMEGVSGLFTREHVWYWEDGVREHIADEGRRLLMLDMNSAAAAALEAGADEVVVCDTHHGGGNVRRTEILADPRISYLEKSVGYEEGRRRWMPGLDDSVGGLMLMGHHARAGTQGAFLPHTWTLEWADFGINGQSVGETGIEACYAGHWSVPLLLVHGDEAGCREASELVPGVVTAPVKRAESEELCSGLEAEAARRLTADKVAEAIGNGRAGRGRPYRPSLPMTIQIQMTTARAAEAAAERPGVARADERTVEGRIERHCDVVKWILGTGLDMPEEGRR